MPPPDRILFLDIDGVLNNEGWSERIGVLSCDPDNVAFLNFILAETGAELVVSSDWRKWMGWDELCERLTGAGVEGVIRDCTPVIEADHPSEVHFHRGREVDAWLTASGYDGRFVILDDRGDLEPHLGVLVRTNPLRGLSAEEAKRAVEILGAREKNDLFSGIDDAEL